MYYWVTHYGHESIVDLVFPLKEYNNESPGVCMMTFPFSLQIPDWLLPSMYLYADEESAELSINYVLRVQMAPTDDNEWMDERKTVSSFSAARMIYVTKAKQPDVDPDQKVGNLDARVGGCLGCFTTPSNFKVTFDKK